MKMIGMTITFERSVKKAEYENEKSGVTITVAPDDAESSLTEADLAAASALTKVQTYTNLGLKVAVGNAGVVTAKPATVTAKAAPAAPSDEGEIGDETPPPKPTAKPAAAKVTTKGKDTGKVPPPPPPAHEPEIDDGEIGEEATEETPGTELDAEPETAKTVTNGDLAKAIGKKVQAMVLAGNPSGSVKVNELIKKYVPAGKQATHPNIPDDKRAKFLAALEAIAAE